MDCFDERTAGSWGALGERFAELGQASEPDNRWIFRGQREASWPVSSRLDRECDRFAIPTGQRTNWEYRIVREFKRHYARFGQPEPTSIIEWLALIQHYGGPTRLIDWTYSFWAAVAFAVEEMRPCEPCAIWAMDFDWAQQRVDQTLPKDVEGLSHDERNRPENLKKVFEAKKKPGMVFVSPFRLNERLAIQQGTFVTTRDLAYSFDENLSATLKSTKASDPSGRFVKIVLDLSTLELKNVLHELHRMNVTRRTLFPGFDGFSQDLHNHIALEGFFVGVKGSIWNDR